MIQNSVPRYFAIHPSWVYEASRLATSNQLLKQYTEDIVNAYTNGVPKLASFEPNDVYQIDENTFYSYGDDLRYKLSSTGQRVAIIDLKGILYSSSWYSSYDCLIQRIKRAEDPAYAGCLILANSPGGSTEGMRRLNKAIQEYSKPIGTHVSGYLASAAAYVTAPSSFIMADPDDNNVFGSIGVFCILENVTEQLEQQKVKVAVIRNDEAVEKFKPNPYEPWAPEDLASVKKGVQDEADDFHKVMEDQRGLSQEQMALVKKGGVFNTEEAISHGLVDDTGTVDEAIEQVIDYQFSLFI